jgi:phosphoglycerate kinase
LTQHAALLSKHTGKPILYVDDVIGEKAVKAISRLKDGEILLLDNIRILEDETLERSAKEHGDSSIVKTLSPLADLFINDAFSVAHRSHASIVGFTTRLPSAAGRVMEQEIRSCEKALNASRPRIFILGGVKADDCVGIMKHMLEKQFLDKALTCGLLGQLLLIVNGFDVGEESRSYLEKKGALTLVPILKDLQSNYAQNMEYPLDVAEQVDGTRVEKNREDLPCKGLIMDIGRKTIDRYRELLENAGSIVVKGPAGVCEEKGFEVGTQALLEKTKSSHAYNLIGGGHTSAVLSSLGLRASDFSYVSVAGGALITYLSGKDLPGLKALEDALPVVTTLREINAKTTNQTKEEF